MGIKTSRATRYTPRDTPASDVVKRASLLMVKIRHILSVIGGFHIAAVQAVVMVGMLSASAISSASGLREQLQELSSLQGFEIQGLELVTREPAREVAGDLRHRIKRLLAGYNYVVIDNEAGSIGKLIILARGTANTEYPPQPVINSVNQPGEHIVPARRRGSHQMVDAVLVGPGQAPVSVSLMVDTGASTVVLPKSMIGQLGFTADSLRDGWTQTANGRVRAKMGKLTSVDVGSAVAEEVKVTFLDDQRLGSSKLLGMSFLQRFSLTIDDANNRIILTNE